MNFSLRIVGGGPTQMQFRNIDPSLPIDDFMAFVINKHLALSNGTSQVAKFISHRVSVLRDDGTSFYSLDESLRPTTAAEDPANTANAAPAPKTVEEAFGFLYDTPDGYGAVGWIHFRDLPLQINVICKLPVTVKDRARAHSSNSTQGHHFTIEGSNLLFLTVDEIRKAVGERVKVPSSHLVLLDPENSNDDEGLTGDVDLFRYLRCYGFFSLRVVKREGITVHVRIADRVTAFPIASIGHRASNPPSRVLSLPRLPFDTTVAQIRSRVYSAFGVSISHLYFDRAPDMLAQRYSKKTSIDAAVGDGRGVRDALVNGEPVLSPLYDGDLLIDLTMNGRDGYFTTAPDLLATGADAAVLTTNSATANAASSFNNSRLTQEDSHFPVNSPPSFGSTSVQRGPPSHQRAARGPESGLNATPSAAAAAGNSRLTRPPSYSNSVPQSVTAKVTIEMIGAASSSPTNRGRRDEVLGGEVVDITLPNDGAPFTAMELKEFIVNNVLQDAQYHELVIFHGRRLLDDEVALQSLLADDQRLGKEGTATILLTCRYRPQ